ncbi:hypothetical protein SYNPS1DRAFT_23349 [Syncephalis pseudoplumigaleata]|uniref:Uncharacterized protein n=1 Tax=Syncephalis pseudoplumigaleata TaxID=1712513 RepID=A0A4P9YWZ3_9FUNG|nr:hypothetical protein SYNPS1DRAFT_23349 [Syncephalis pseudoplumigaleata]|eukprot:RKP24577.1 hypothetical protein SYNPS1DRAFT_23349 [Syncephalis pseudoplumigaleata]
MLTMGLAAEEADVTSIGLLPGRTDTDMLATICNEGTDSMDPATYDTFKKGRDEGSIHAPDVPAKAIVALALHARGEQWNGRNVLWNDADVQRLV